HCVHLDLEGWGSLEAAQRSSKSCARNVALCWKCDRDGGGRRPGERSCARSGAESWRGARSAPRWFDAEAVEELHRLRVRHRRGVRSKSIEDVERASMLAKGELAA